MSFSGLALGTTYEINISAFNSSGVAWNRIALELLDPAGNSNDTLDPSSQPAFVPVGFSTSNNNDGLSFAQGTSRPRFSYEFSKVFADELSDQRDFLDFYDGTVPTGQQAWLQFSLVNTSAENLSFLLVQRPNAFSATVVPVPAALPLLASGLAIFGLIARRRKQRFLGRTDGRARQVIASGRQSVAGEGRFGPAPRSHRHCEGDLSPASARLTARSMANTVPACGKSRLKFLFAGSPRRRRRFPAIRLKETDDHEDA